MFSLYYSAKDKRVHCVNGSGRCPGKLTLDAIQKKYPKDAMIIKRLQIVIMTFSTRNLSLQKLDALFPNAEAWILNYLLGHDKSFEQYALKHDNNIVLFPKD